MTLDTALDLPALRWSDPGGYGLGASWVGDALARGVPGFILFGGEAAAARAAVLELEERAGRRLLVGADLERGAGQQFEGATPLPPLAALGALGDLDVVRAAGEITGREAVALGVPWVFAPVADLSLERANPIVGTRAFGADPEQVGLCVAAWIQGCRSAGAIPCVKHFPGHGRTVTDSHAELPVVEEDRTVLAATDLRPFLRALEAGVPSIMTAHVAYPAFDPSGVPATRSRPIVSGLLRGELGFDGVVVSDALIMEGAGDPEAAAVEAVNAGVDLLLYPPQNADLSAVLRRAAEAGALPAGRIAGARRRLGFLLESLPGVGSGEGGWGSLEDRDTVLAWALKCLRPAGRPPRLASRVALTIVDDDTGGPFPPPSRDGFPEALRREGVNVVVQEGVGPVHEPTEGGTALVAVYAEPRAWKGRAGLSGETLERIRAWAEAHPDPSRTLVVLFGGPHLSAELPPGYPMLLAWGGEPLMQEAAARWIHAGSRE